MLEKVQKRAIRMVRNLKGKTYGERLVEANLEIRRFRGDLIQMYRLMTGKDEVDPRIWFQNMADNSLLKNIKVARSLLKNSM